jgi:hypothetical protein
MSGGKRITSGGVLFSLPEQNGTAFQEHRHILHGPVRDQFLRAFGALGGDDDPFLGKEILA